MSNGKFRSFGAAALAAVAVVSLSGCAAGDFGLTRSVARWNLSFSPVPRVLICIGLYIVPVYELSMVFDLLINNTVQFWSDSAVISAKSTQKFQKDGYLVTVTNMRGPLKRSIFKVYDKHGSLRSTGELRETNDKTIDVYIDGVKKDTVQNVRDGLSEIIKLV